MRAILLAGGKGTRLKPYTTLLPKPLVPIGDRYAIVEIVIMQLIKNGFTHVTLALNHLSKLIMSYFGDGSELGIKIDYSIETTELGTVAPLTLIADLPEDFLVMNADILCDLDYKLFMRNHCAEKNYVSVSAFQREVKVDFGVLRYDQNNILSSFEEKPILEYNVSMGVYAFNRAVLKNIPRNTPFGFDNLMLDSLKNQKTVKIFPFNGFWLDVGRPADYAKANENANEILEKIIK